MPLPARYTVEPAWNGRTAVILGSGPSFTLKQNQQIAIARNRPSSPLRVIAVNNAVFGAWWADWLHACDNTWWHTYIQSVHTFPGIKTTLAHDVPEPWVTGYLQNTGPDGFDPDPSCCRTGANGVYQAMCIAIHSGVRRIILIGVDMKEGPRGEKHWFGDHPGLAGAAKVDYAKTMIPKFAGLLPTLEARGIEVVNATPGTALHTFPLMELEKALA